jgi:hypothetical protein
VTLSFQKASRALARTCAILVVLALLILSLRSIFRFDGHFDSLVYHLAFAAERAGVPFSYDMNDSFRYWYEGFPPLADFAQGILWRLSGTIQATVVTGLLVFLGLLYYSHRYLRAPFWLVAMISLSAPLVIIHSTSNYIDLFGNCFLALGFVSALSLFLFPGRDPRIIYVTGLTGLAAAMCSKFLLVPLAGIGFLFFLVMIVSSKRPIFHRRSLTFAVFGILAAVALMPYVLNFIRYDNPFWPVRVPFFGKWFPYMIDGEALGAASNRPSNMLTASRLKLFVHSLLEIGHPTSYDYRPRWLLDQGNPPTTNQVAFRMGGFWGIGFITYFTSMISLLIAYAGRRGIIAAASFVLLLLVASQIPQSHELRYFLFFPLCWAITIGMFYPKLSVRQPNVSFGMLAVFLGFFLYMAWENRAHYRVEHFNYAAVAGTYGLVPWWDKLDPKETYCVVGMVPAGIFMSGPTLKEFKIFDRSNSSKCPLNSYVITFEGLQKFRGESVANDYIAQELNYRARVLFGNNEIPASIKIAKRGIKMDPSNAEAHSNLCFIYGQARQWENAIAECKRAIELRPDFGMAHSNLASVLAAMEKEKSR